jgi:CheY-like chemotaxis protein
MFLCLSLPPGSGGNVLKQDQNTGVPNTEGSVILCVDDEPTLLAIRQLVLAAAGYQVLPAETGRAALELYKQQHVDLVITDHLLPDMSGAQVALEIKKMRPSVPIILLSGLPEAPEGAEYADMFLTKGMSVPHLLSTIAKLLKRHNVDSQYGT